MNDTQLAEMGAALVDSVQSAMKGARLHLGATYADDPCPGEGPQCPDFPHQHIGFYALLPEWLGESVETDIILRIPA